MKHKIICGDYIEVMKDIENESIDLIVTDPPYNVLALEWDKNKVSWEMLTEECYRVLKINGSIFIFGQMPMINHVFCEMSKKLKFKQDLVWYKNRGFSLATTIFTKYHENILFFVKGNEECLKKFGDYIKEVRMRKGISLKQMGKFCNEKWYHRGGHMYFETGLTCPTKDQYKKLQEVLKLNDVFNCLFDRPTFNFEEIKLEGKPYRITRNAQKLYGVKSNLGEYTKINDGKRNPKTVLEYPIVQSGNEYCGHPTQKPKDMIKRLVMSCSLKKDIVLDVFLGSGTTSIVAEELQRNSIGIELSKEYCEIAYRRLLKEVSQLKIDMESSTIEKVGF